MAQVSPNREKLFMYSLNDPELLGKINYAAYETEAGKKVRDDNNALKTDVNVFISAARAQSEEISLAESRYFSELSKQIEARAP
jgi:hypothetical protein